MAIATQEYVIDLLGKSIKKAKDERLLSVIETSHAEEFTYNGVADQPCNICENLKKGLYLITIYVDPGTSTTIFARHGKHDTGSSNTVTYTEFWLLEDDDISNNNIYFSPSLTGSGKCSYDLIKIM